MGSSLSISFCAGPFCLTTPLDGNSTSYANGTIPGYDDGKCHLSPFDSHLSTVLTAFIGSIIAGVTAGFFVPFFTAWISWFASLRILLVALWEVCEVVRLRPVVGGEQFFNFWDRVPLLGRLVSSGRDFNSSFFRRSSGRVGKDEDGGQVTVLGWIGWLWATCYAPTTQTLWLVKNWTHPSGGLMIARGLGVAVAALPLTMDVKGRYGEALARLVGGWAHVAFSMFGTVSLLVLGALSATELVLGVVKGVVGTSYWVVAIYVVIMLLWTFGSFSFDAPTDEGFATKGFGKLLAGFAMGCFGGVFVAIPAFVLMMRSPHAPGLAVGDYLRCESVSLWERLTAVLP